MTTSDLKDIIFILVAGSAIFGAGFAAFSRSLINAALGLLLSLIAIAGIYIFLSADFIAVSQILIYVGGVMVLIIFGIMLTSGSGNVYANNPILKGIYAGLMTLTFIGVSFYVIHVADLNLTGGKFEPSTREIGNLLLKDYILPFELVSVLIVVLIVGAGVMLRKEMFIQKENKESDSE
jgi:NADH-quinone oxidoreductase subunit J